MYAKTPTVYQMESTECGAASLAMILGYWGCHVPLEQLRVDTGVSRDGCNARNILRGCRKYGLRARGFRKEPESLKKMEMPCIIHWNFNHFVVLEGFRGKRVYINDPACGRRILTMQDLDECFTGVVLTFEKQPEFRKTKKPNHITRFVFGKLSRQWQALFALLCLGFFLILPGMIIPVLSQVFMDQVLVAQKASLGASIISALLLVSFSQTFLVLYRSYLQEKLNQKVSLMSAHDFFQHLFRLPMSFFDQRALGDLVGRNENNDTVNQFLMGRITEVVLNLFTALFYVILLYKYSPVLLLIGIGGLLLNLALARYSGKVMAAASEKQQVDEGKFSGMVYAAFSISDTLKAAGVENEYCARIIGQQAKSADLEQRAGKLQHYVETATSVLDQLMSILMLIVGGVLVIRGHMTAGMLVAFTSLFDSFAEPIQNVIGFMQQMQSLRADMGRVDDVMRYPEDLMLNNAGETVQDSGKLRGSITVSDITFGYGVLDPPLIEGFSLQLAPGQSVALVGASGSGKSTVGKLISGLYSPWSGTVAFDGAKYNSIPDYVINSSIATVSQNIVLFSGSVRENLTMWNNNVIESDLIAAAKDACIHDVITSKQGAYEYILTENGTNFSGGQRQRMEIARALAQNPSILVLDEATSALDPGTEKQIIDNIKRRGCTCVVIAHRLSAIRDCDEIVVLERGKIVQRGTHDALMNQEGLYQDLVKNM